MKGFLKQKAEIIEDNTQKVIGLIVFSNFRTKVHVQFEGKSVLWKYDNLWCTKWSFTDQTGLILTCDGSFTAGRIDSSFENVSLLLVGFFITHYYYSQLTVIMLCVITILLVSIK